MTVFDADDYRDEERRMGQLSELITDIHEATLVGHGAIALTLEAVLADTALLLRLLALTPNEITRTEEI